MVGRVCVLPTSSQSEKRVPLLHIKMARAGESTIELENDTHRPTTPIKVLLRVAFSTSNLLARHPVVCEKGCFSSVWWRRTSKERIIHELQEWSMKAKQLCKFTKNQEQRTQRQEHSFLSSVASAQDQRIWDKWWTGNKSSLSFWYCCLCRVYGNRINIWFQTLSIGSLYANGKMDTSI